MQKLMVDLGHELKQFDEELSDDDPNEIVPTVSTTTLSAEHLAGDLTLRLYPQAMKYIAEHLGGNRYRFFTSGGGMRYLGLYSTVYKTTREGQFEALLDDVRIQLDVEIHEDNEQISDVKAKACPIEHERVASRFDSRGVKLSFKRMSSREKRSALDNSAEHKVPTSEMGSVAVTEEYINEMLFDLTENDNIIFHLHRIPEVQQVLRTSCDDKRCLGALVDLNRVTDGSGHLNSRVTSTPRFKIDGDQATLHLSLNTVLSFENRAAHHRIPYLRFDTALSARLTYNVHTDFEELKIVANHLEEHLQLHRNKIEDLLSTHLGGEVPLRINSHVHLKPQPAVFGLHRVLIPFNFELDRKLLPPFQFFRTSFI
ncbi:unnamed protein product [Nippostrongylus brasiliensis]|uniref:BPI2 domain-containing protein n=1 Tax=Nippostrongylus brasiliensis TaxID=27835 RepID=A0A158R3E8_NIPBR|nr:unnamed protein product [Nippostrongylus brasiliensis]